MITATRLSSSGTCGSAVPAIVVSSMSVVPPPLMTVISFRTRWKCWTPGSLRPNMNSSSANAVQAALHAVAGGVVLVHDDVVEPVARVVGRLALVVVLRLVAQRHDLLGVRGVPASCRAARATPRPASASHRRPPARGTASRWRRRTAPDPTAPRGRSTALAIGRSANELRWCGPHCRTRPCWRSSSGTPSCGAATRSGSPRGSRR